MADPVQKIYDKTSISLSSQIALGLAMPPIIPFKTIVTVPAIDKDGYVAEESLQNSINNGLMSLGSTAWQVPLTFTIDGKDFLLPIDPIISLASKNILIRRYVSKKSEKERGTVKERWSQDDWEISISGVLMSDDDYPSNSYATGVNEYIQKLLEICKYKGSVSITCDLLNNVFGINQIAIEDYDFPFTPGTENQQFNIKCYSDDMVNLLIES